MEQDFLFWRKKHDSGSLELFNTDSTGQLWIKLKSIIRRELIDEFIAENNIALNSRKSAEQFEELFCILSKDVAAGHKRLDAYIQNKNKEILKCLDTEKLVSELYKLKVFEWGGDYRNSLDKYLISHYVKTKAILPYEILLSKFDTEINHTVKGYVLNSWYDHWSSILIEHIFKSHSIVLPTVGQIKNVDFFINDIPFDLKVTHFPAEFLKQKRKEKGLPVELTYLKSKAKELEIPFDKNANQLDIYYEITEKLKDKGTRDSLAVISQLKHENMTILKETQNNAKSLSKWLYENQGEMRFGSENRIFLILVDTDTPNFVNSWKLKRNIELLKPTISSFLDDFGKKSIKDLEVNFTYSGKQGVFHSLAEVIFVIKSQ